MSPIRSFDRIARPYRVLEYLTLGRLLEQTRLHFLPRLLECRNALVLGDGDGRFLAHLLTANGSVQATTIDYSAEMLRLLRQRCAPYADRLRTQQIDALSFAPPADTHYDLVVTHFFLDCLTQSELERLTARLAPNLAPCALWLVSDFRIPSGPLRWPARALIRSLYLAFRIITGLRSTQLPNHAAALETAGFQRMEQRPFLGGILITELWRCKSPGRVTRMTPAYCLEC